MPTKRFNLTLPDAVNLLRSGDIVAIPTETVYGLAADACNDHAVANIFALKNRPRFNPLIVHVDSQESAALYVKFNEIAHQLAQAFWPGPLTMVLPMKSDSAISPLVSAGLQTLAVRVPNHPLTLELLQRSQMPLAAPSANVSSTLSPSTAAHVDKSFAGQVNVIDGGASSVGLESTIIDVTGSRAKLLRPGGLAREDIEKIIGPIEVATLNVHKPTSPGQLLKHYAPKRPLRLNATSIALNEALLAFGENVPKDAAQVLNLSPKGNLTEAAANFFSMLHELDQPCYQAIAVMPIPNQGLGVAINDRLRRASESDK